MTGLPVMSEDWTYSLRKLISVLFLVIPVLIFGLGRQGKKNTNKKSLLMKYLAYYQHGFNLEKDKPQNK